MGHPAERVPHGVLHVVTWWEVFRQAGHRVPTHAGRLLKRLADDGWTVVLATSAGGHELSALRRALDLAGVPAGRAVFVGDTVWDMRAGSAAGVRCVGLLCGGIPRRDLEEAGAGAVFGDPARLLAAQADSPPA
ncbi:HAD hydrolase-like protein [Streptomyces sp. NPDC026672]|uniref:HAD family hydrolase n=1 Tax=unclassified Streptomyces TaxID=2593676 RepID=UPI0033CD5BED